MEVRGICFWHTRDFFKRRLDIEKNLANRPLHVQFVQRTNGKVKVSFTWSLAWENSRHLATLPLVFPPNDVREKSAEIPYWWRVTTQSWVVLLIGWIKFPTRYYQSEALPKSGYWRVISMEFLRSFLRSHLAGKPVVASPNVGCFLRLLEARPKR